MAQESTTMTRYIAFLRAINVGGRTVKMDQLRELFEALGFSNVETFIASGNVIFESKESNARALEQQIERHLQASLGYQVDTFIRSASELAGIATYQPFTMSELDDGDWSLYIAFVSAPPDAKAEQALMAYRTEDDDFHIHEREIYWLRRGRISESAFSGALLEKAIRMPATMRNANTIRRIAAKYPAS